MKSCGVPVTTVMPSRSQRSRTNGIAMTATRFLVEARDDVARRSRRHEQPPPVRGLVARHARFGNGRRFRNGGNPPGSRHAEQAQAPGADLGQRRRRARRHRRYAPRDEIEQPRAGPLVRHVQHLRPGHHEEQLHREMRQGAGTRRGERDLAGPRPRERHELLHRLRRQRRVDHQHVRHRHELGNRQRDRAGRRTGTLRYIAGTVAMVPTPRRTV